MCLALDIEKTFVRMIDQSKGFCGYLRRNVERQMIDCLQLPLEIPPQTLLMRIERGMIMSLAGDSYLRWGAFLGCRRQKMAKEFRGGVVCWTMSLANASLRLPKCGFTIGCRRDVARRCTLAALRANCLFLPTLPNRHYQGN
jgi:hypothetical protein